MVPGLHTRDFAEISCPTHGRIEAGIGHRDPIGIGAILLDEIALLTSWLYLPWVIKPLWSPVVDLLGTKRLWTVATQGVIAAVLAMVALSIVMVRIGKRVWAAGRRRARGVRPLEVSALRETGGLGTIRA